MNMISRDDHHKLVLVKYYNKCNQVDANKPYAITKIVDAEPKCESMHLFICHTTIDWIFILMLYIQIFKCVLINYEPVSPMVS